MPECENCGGELQDPRDKAGGWWREKCVPCMSEESPDVDRETPIAESDAYQEWLENGQ
jgi:hypothetical protein